MKNLLAVLLLLGIGCCAYAISNEDKEIIDDILNTPIFGSIHPKRDAADAAKREMNKKYDRLYFDCEQVCRAQYSKEMVAADKFNVFQNPDALRQKARENFAECLESQCKPIYNVQLKGCFNYIKEMVEED